MATGAAIQAPDGQTAPAAVDRRSLPVTAAVAGTLAFATSYAASLLGHTLVFLSDHAALAWPPNAVVLTALLLSRPRVWPAYLFGALAASVVVDLQQGGPGWIPTMFAGANMAECLLAAVVIRRFLGGPPRLDRLRDVVVYLVAGAGLAPLAAVSAATAVVVMAGLGSDLVDDWRMWLMGDVLTHATLTALLLAWLAPAPARSLTTARRVELGVCGGGLVLVSLFVFHAPEGVQRQLPDVLYMPLPLLLWTAVRFGARGATGAVAVVAALATLGAVAGRGPFASLAPADAVLHLQLFLLIITVPILLFAAVVAERREARAALRQSEARPARTEAASSIVDAHVGVLGYENITHLEQAAAELRALTGRLLRLQDEERRRIARELHDGAGQNLVALSMNLARLARLVRADERTGGIVADSLALVEQSLQEMRTLSYVLYPPTLDGVGLTSAIRWYVAGFAKRSAIDVRLDLPPDADRLPQEMENALFRVIQESLINIHRHSGSGTAAIRLRREPGVVRLDVTDEGAGFAHALPGDRQGSFGGGIPGMRERLRQLGGHLDIRSDRRGTTVTAVAPLLVESDAAHSVG